jgi:hypothetical protein
MLTEPSSTLFFLFYFNRLFGTLVSFAIRAYTWNKYDVYFDVQALQISLLGGRIFFKGLRYHGSNETIQIQSGFITWVYWLRHVRQLELSQDENVREPLKHSSDLTQDGNIDPEIPTKVDLDARFALPCRLSLEIKGLEWFVYNRTPAYDSIIESLSGPSEKEKKPVTLADEQEYDGFGRAPGLKSRKLRKPKEHDEEKHRHEEGIDGSYTPPEKGQSPKSSLDDDRTSTISTATSSASAASEEQVPLGVFLRLLPLQVRCDKAALVIGNENTRSVFITKADKFTGDIDATSCKRPDLYRQFFKFNLVNPKVQLKANDDYKEDQVTAALRTKDRVPQSHPRRARNILQTLRRRIWRLLKILTPRFRSSANTISSATSSIRGVNEPPLQDTGFKWHGLSRYLDDNEQDERAKWSSIEYATVTTIVDSPAASLCYYWDEPGKVPMTLGPQASFGDTADAPEWGLEITIKGAVINYGPWADRQRAELQKVFFPTLCKDSEPATPPRPGNPRVATRLKVYVQLDEETVLRVPIREESKNWKWKAEVDNMVSRVLDQKKESESRFRRKAKEKKSGPEVRPFGWLDLKTSTNTTINYSMDMVGDGTGFNNTLQMELPSVEITSSVNHGVLWRSQKQQLLCDLSNPLGWNQLRIWTFDFMSDGVELFLLREHVFLLIDLIDDWTSGPPGDFLTFTPFRYLMNVKLADFKINFNVNDANIINNPSDFEDNTFLTLSGSALSAIVGIPLDQYRPYRNDVTFDIRGEGLALELSVPPWNTQKEFLTDKRVGSLRQLNLNGKYQYCDTTSPSNTDTLLLNVSGAGLELQLYGFLIRYIMKIKDNYFGEDLHFKTLEEYQRSINPGAAGTSAFQKPPYKKTNDIDVILNITADDCCAIFPSHLYSAKDHVRVEISALNVDLRFTNYYMDLQVHFSPLALFSGVLETPGGSSSSTSSCQLYIDGLQVFGNRLFGLPPTEPTYLCNWDFAIGPVTGETSTDFLPHAIAAARAFAFSFDDDENALPPAMLPIIHDATFLRLVVDSVDVCVRTGETALKVSLSTTTLNFNDWATQHYSKKLRLQLPDIRVSCFDIDHAFRSHSRTNVAETHAYIAATIDLTMVGRKAGFEEGRRSQQNHIRREDSRTTRTPFLLLLDQAEILIDPVDAPAMGLPGVPLPLRKGAKDQDIASLRSSSSSAQSSRRGLRRQSSFMTSSSSHDSVRRQSLSTSGPFKAKPATNPSETVLQQHTNGGARDDISQPQKLHTGSKTQHASAVVFSSPFMPPCSKLMDLVPNTQNVPSIESADLRYVREESDMSFTEQIFDDSYEYTSFIIEFRQGVRAYCKPEAINMVAQVINAIQPTQPDDILDELQVSSISEIFTNAKETRTAGRNTDVNIVIPAIRVRFDNPLKPAMEDFVEHPVDQYDLGVQGLSVTSRSRVSLQKESQLATHSSAVHVKLQTGQISARERYTTELDDLQSAVHLRVDEIVAWMTNNDAVSGCVEIHDIKTGLMSSQIEYLAGLLNRTAVLTSEVSEVLMKLAESSKRTVQKFAYLLVDLQPLTSNPVVLTRVSPVLRSARDHLRNSDSWKTMTLLRHVYLGLDADNEQLVQQRMHSLDFELPSNARQHVVSRLEQLRSWDLESIGNCELMRRLFGITPVLGSVVTKPVQVTMLLHGAEFILDPGEKENVIALSRLAASVSIDRKKSSEHSALIGPRSVQLTVIEAYCSDVSIDLNWELCELVKTSLSIFTENRPNTVSTPKAIKGPDSTRAVNIEKQIQVVVATDDGSITLKAINVEMFSFSRGLKGSLLIADTPSPSKSLMTALITSEDITTKWSGQQLPLAKYQVLRPSLSLSRETATSSGIEENIWAIAGKSEELSFALEQDPIGVLLTLDKVVCDEFAELLQLSELAPEASPPPVQTSSTTTAHKVNVALFLDVYHIQIPLLPSLQYGISGDVARASLRTKADADFIFDFDIKKNSHYVQASNERKSSKMALLQLPPTTGRVTVKNGPVEMLVSASASIEPIRFDATVVRSLFATLNKPEVSTVVSDVQTGWKDLQHHLSEVLKSTSPSLPKKKTTTTKLVMYEGRITLAGLEMYIDAPDGLGSRQNARLSFVLGSSQIAATNRMGVGSGRVSRLPQFRVKLEKIGLDLSLRHEDGRIITHCGDLSLAVLFTGTCQPTDGDEDLRVYDFQSDRFHVNLYAETASTIVNVVGHLQNRIKELDLGRDGSYFQRRRTPKVVYAQQSQPSSGNATSPMDLFPAMFSVLLSDVQLTWVANTPASADDYAVEDLVLSLQRIQFGSEKKNSARLDIRNFMVQMVPSTDPKDVRGPNSALLPEVIFNIGYVATMDAMRIAFQAKGKSVDIRLNSQFITPALHIKSSIEEALNKVRLASASWVTSPASERPSDTTKKMFLRNKRIESLLVDADFAGAKVHLQGLKRTDTTSRRYPPKSRAGQDAAEEVDPRTTLTSPGLALKIEFQDNGKNDALLNAEVKVERSENELQPHIVPLVLEISSNIKAAMSTSDTKAPATKLLKETTPERVASVVEDNILTTDPSTVLGRTRLNLGIRICEQSFRLSCKPIARVTGTAKLKEIYMTINTVESEDHGHFFAVSASIDELDVSVKHLYSREDTGSFRVPRVVLSLMNSKHVSGTSGLSAILKFDPMNVLVNAKQIQDFLLFRDIWLPQAQESDSPPGRAQSPEIQPQTYLVKRYQEVAATAAFPWNATVSIAQLNVKLELGQSIGTSTFKISNFWISTKKNSDWEQNMSLGFESVGITSSGRMNGFTSMEDFRIRTSIQWPEREKAYNQTPLVQGSVSFSQFRLKAAFDYQPFLIADITSFRFLMYNVRNGQFAKGDRLVSMLDGDSVQIFCTTATASQALALYQAFERLLQDKRQNYAASVREMQRFMLRKPSSVPAHTSIPDMVADKPKDITERFPVTLHTDVVINLKEVTVGAYPSSFFDPQVFKVEVNDAQFRFAAAIIEGRIHSRLGATLGQLRIGLASLRHSEQRKSSGDVTVEDVVSNATGARGGIILRVPRVQATMETWQTPSSNHIDYRFRSLFEGKVEVGWNYSRISYIRGMFANHEKLLAQRLGKPLPPSAVKITGVPEAGEDGEARKGSEGQTITAEINVPQSKYDYTALEPPIIDTPQLRDMGEATPPLEWIGLHRDRLPNLTHQIFIVTLLELASEVEDAYAKILGSS